MPRYAYQKPRAKVYAYNYGYMNNYYKPMTHYLSKDPHYPIERPGAQSLAERLKKFPLDGTIYPDKDVEYLPSMYAPRDYERQVSPSPPRMELEDEPMPAVLWAPREYYPQQKVQEYYPQQKVQEYYPQQKVQEPEMKLRPLFLKHPYRLPVEDEVMPLAESSIWPEGRKHFDLVSSYDLMCGYLGLSPSSVYSR